MEYEIIDTIREDTRKEYGFVVDYVVKRLFVAMREPVALMEARYSPKDMCYYVTIGIKDRIFGFTISEIEPTDIKQLCDTFKKELQK